MTGQLGIRPAEGRERRDGKEERGELGRVKILKKNTEIKLEGERLMTQNTNSSSRGKRLQRQRSSQILFYFFKESVTLLVRIRNGNSSS